MTPQYSSVLAPRSEKEALDVCERRLYSRLSRRNTSWPLSSPSELSICSLIETKRMINGVSPRRLQQPAAEAAWTSRMTAPCVGKERMALFRGVCSGWSALFGDAPAAGSSCVRMSLPRPVATCEAVLPVLSGLSTSMRWQWENFKSSPRDGFGRSLFTIGCTNVSCDGGK